MPGAIWVFGPILFQATPYNVHEFYRTTGADWAAKDVVQPVGQDGRGIGPTPRPREWVGEGDDHIHFVGVTFPTRLINHQQIGGLSGPDSMQRVQRAHTPLLLLRMDGTSFGYRAVERIVEHQTLLNERGVGKVFEYEIFLVRVPDDQGVQSNADVTASIIAQTLGPRLIQ